ncbi:MAG: DUF3540 domain-containing protein [Xanthomonadales bacterium]|nr:DUF3540 domain-containing protein [Xanthomonadales bacterium]
MRTLNADSIAPAAPVTPAAPVALADTRITVLFDDGSCLLGNGMRALRAVSCLVELQIGDRVLVSTSTDGPCHVLHILARNMCIRSESARNESGSARLSVPGATGMSLCQARIAVHAAESLHMGSAGDASLSAAGGTLSLNGRNLFVTVTDSIVEQASHYVGKIGQYLLDVRALLRLHGNDALFTAANDIKVDAERISMG